MTNDNRAEASSPATIAEQTVETSTTVVSSTGNKLQELKQAAVEFVRKMDMSDSAAVTENVQQFLLRDRIKPSWWDLTFNAWRDVLNSSQSDFLDKLNKIAAIKDTPWKLLELLAESC